jgi:putative holliday junction resolvase
MRILAIDLGTRRVGIAISDPDERFALPLEVIARRSDRDLLDQLCSIAVREEAELLLVGEPRRLDGSAGEGVIRARDFASRLAEQSGLAVETIDEALSSDEAARRRSQLAQASGAGSSVDARSRRVRRSVRATSKPLDAIAAQVFLEDFLDRRKRP